MDVVDNFKLPSDVSPSLNPFVNGHLRVKEHAFFHLQRHFKYISIFTREVLSP
jgi:hypothetical protein